MKAAMSSVLQIIQDVSLLTPNQWLELAAVVVISLVAMHVVARGACWLEDRRQKHHSAEVDKCLEEIRRMPD